MGRRVLVPRRVGNRAGAVVKLALAAGAAVSLVWTVAAGYAVYRAMTWTP